VNKHLRRSALPIFAAAFFALSGCNGGGTTEPTPGGGGAGGGTTTTGARRPDPTAEGNTAQGNTVIIGLVASQNGELRPWGDDCVKGARLALDEFNAAGGLDGYTVELRVEDSASRPEVGKSATEKLIANGALAIVGEIASGITAQMAQSAFEQGVPLVAVGATRIDITDIGSNIFRVCYTDDFQGPVMATFAYDELGLRNMAILTDKKQPYSTGLSQSFAQHFQRLGGTIVAEENYESGQSTFTSQLTNIAARNPDGLFMSGYFTEVGPIARQAREAGIKVPLLGGDGWDSNEILTSGGEAILGGFFCNHYNNREDRPEVRTFLEKWRQRHGGVPATTMGALGYDATMLTLDALRRATAMNSRAVQQAIADTEGFQGVSGIITLRGQNGDPPKRALVVELTPEGQVFRKAYEHGDIQR
jgi:branched-chain amino acid transport system substrate-binding protein